MCAGPADMDIEVRLHHRIACLSAGYAEFLRALVKTPSPSGAEGPCQALVEKRMREIGVFEKRVYVKDSPSFVPTGREYGQRPCIVGRLPGQGSRSFILNAHIDTAPVEDPSSWAYPPFSAHVEGNCLHGRGAVDDKAGIAMMLLLADSFRQGGSPLPCDLIFESVIEEEDSGNGTLACTQAVYYCDAAIILDGTWPFRAINAHLGQLEARFTIEGQPAPSANARRGRNPIPAAAMLVSALERMTEEINAATPSWHGLEAPCIVNAGVIRAGVYSGSVPEGCYLECLVGFPPPWTVRAVQESVAKVAADVAQESGCPILFSPGNLRVDPYENPSSGLAQLVEETVIRLRGNDFPFKTVAVSGYGDMRNLRTASGELAPVCLYGPGGGANAHCRDEYYRLDHFTMVAQNVASVILTWAGLLPAGREAGHTTSAR